MGLLQWLRGDADGPSSTVGAAALMELDANLSPARRQQIENLETLESLREEEGTAGKGHRHDTDLESGTTTVRLPRT